MFLNSIYFNGLGIFPVVENPYIFVNCYCSKRPLLHSFGWGNDVLGPLGATSGRNFFAWNT